MKWAEENGKRKSLLPSVADGLTALRFPVMSFFGTFFQSSVFRTGLVTSCPFTFSRGYRYMTQRCAKKKKMI